MLWRTASGPEPHGRKSTGVQNSSFQQMFLECLRIETAIDASLITVCKSMCVTAVCKSMDHAVQHGGLLATDSAEKNR